MTRGRSWAGGFPAGGTGFWEAQRVVQGLEEFRAVDDDDSSTVCWGTGRAVGFSSLGRAELGRKEGVNIPGGETTCPET